MWLCVFSLKCVCPSMCVYVQKIRINLDPQLFHPPFPPIFSMPLSVCLSVTLLPCYCSAGGSLWSLCVGQFGQSVYDVFAECVVDWR